MQNKSSSLSFTLPISCQICLGKVKQPVICPNQHVFCGICLEVWLQRNNQCPACRVCITSENPCRPILGGLSHQDGVEGSSKALRKARSELLFKEYEDEIERLERDNSFLREENTMFHQKLQNQTAVSESASQGVQRSPTQADKVTLATLTKKLQDATYLYDQVKSELKKIKQENISLKETNANLKFQIHTLRSEVSSRSPRKFGRYTVAALENRVESHEKVVGQLTKALQRSDSYIEELQNEIQQLRSNNRDSAVAAKKEIHDKPPIGEMDSTNNTLDVTDSRQDMFTSVNNTRDFSFGDSKENSNNKNSTLDLELPSPITPHNAKNKLEFPATDVVNWEQNDTDSQEWERPLIGGDKGNDSQQLSVEECRKRLRFTCDSELFSFNRNTNSQSPGVVSSHSGRPPGVMSSHSGRPPGVMSSQSGRPPGVVNSHSGLPPPGVMSSQSDRPPPAVVNTWALTTNTSTGTQQALSTGENKPTSQNNLISTNSWQNLKRESVDVKQLGNTSCTFVPSGMVTTGNVSQPVTVTSLNIPSTTGLIFPSQLPISVGTKAVQSTFVTSRDVTSAESRPVQSHSSTLSSVRSFSTDNVIAPFSTSQIMSNVTRLPSGASAFSGSLYVSQSKSVQPASSPSRHAVSAMSGHHTATPSHNVPGDLNISMTPEIEDCLRLFDEAEKNVGRRKSQKM